MKIAPNTYTTYAEAEKARKQKQVQFPNYYTRVHETYNHNTKRKEYKVQVK